MDFRDTTVVQLAHEIRTGARSAERLMRDTLARINEHNPQLNAFVALAESDALREQDRKSVV